MALFKFFSFFCMTISANVGVLIDLFLLFVHNFVTKIYVFLTRNYGPHLLFSFIYTQPFDKDMRSYFLFCA